MKITLGASVRMSGEIGYEKEVEKPIFYGMFVVVSAFVRTRAQVERETHNLKVVGSNPTPATK